MFSGVVAHPVHYAWGRTMKRIKNTEQKLKAISVSIFVVISITACGNEQSPQGAESSGMNTSSHSKALMVDAGMGDCCDNASCWGRDKAGPDGIHPSWCDGYYKCNCWGGCKYYAPATLPDGGTGTVCPREAGKPEHTKCCEGDYPYDPAGWGYCVPAGSSCNGGESEGDGGTGSDDGEFCAGKDDGTFCDDGDDDHLCTGMCKNEVCESSEVRTSVAGCCHDTTDCYDSNDYAAPAPSCQQKGCNGEHRCVFVDSPPGTECSLDVDAGGPCYEGSCENIDGGLFACLPQYKEDAYDNCSEGTGDLGTLEGWDTDGAYLEAFGSNRCTENDYNASTATNCMEKAPAGSDPIPLGQNGHDVVYSFTIEESLAKHQRYSYEVKLESNFNGVVYVKEDEPCNDVDVRECHYPGRDYEVVIEDECHQNEVMMCEGFPEYGCFTYCTREYNGGEWEYPDLPYTCKPEIYGQVAVATIYPGSDFISPRTFYVFVDSHSSDQKGGDFRLSVTKHRYYNNPCNMPRDNPRVMDVTSGGTFYGSMHNYVNSMLKLCEEAGTCDSPDECMCGIYDDNEPDNWTGKSLVTFSSGEGSCEDDGTDTRSCHSPGLSLSNSYHADPQPSAFWPAQAHYKIDRSGVASGSQTYCIYLDQDTSQYIDGVIGVWKRDADEKYGVCDAIYSYGTCNTGHGGSRPGVLELEVQAGEFYMINVSEFAPHSDGAGGHRPCLENIDDTCEYVLNVQKGACDCSVAGMDYDYPPQPPDGDAYLVTPGNDHWIPAASGSSCNGTHCFEITALSGNDHTSASGGGDTAWAGKDQVIKVKNGHSTQSGTWNVYVYHRPYRECEWWFFGCRSWGEWQELSSMAVYSCMGDELGWATTNTTTTDDPCAGLSVPTHGDDNRCVYTRINEVDMGAGDEIYIVVDTAGNGNSLGEYRVFMQAQ